MKTNNLPFTQTTLWVSIATIAGLLIYALSFEWIGMEGFWAYRGGAVMATGVVAFVLMTLCMVTSIRSKTIEKYFHGLDKMYHLHKWAAIFAFTWTVLHWFAERGIKLMAMSGVATFPPRVRGAAPDPETIPAWWSMIEQFETPAQIFGEYGFYVLIAFILFALLAMIPYSFFQKLHRFIAVLYLLFAFHSIIFMPQAWWSAPTAYLIIALSIVGSYGAITSLLRTYQRKHRYEATIEAIDSTDTGIIDLTLKLKNGKRFDYDAGQFVFIDFSPIEGAHPFSIGAATPDTLRFAIKPSGDFTKKMLDLIHTGQTVSVEGPYGHFDFNTSQPNQIWVAGGIGIAPFISQLQALAQKPKHAQKIDFWYSTMTEEENNFPAQLGELCKKANVKLHRVISNKDGFLNAEKIIKKVGQDKLGQSSVWFCGPQKFGSSLKEGLIPLGLATSDFHTEIFNFR